MVETLSPPAVEALLKKNYIGHLACCEDNIPYVVPITYYYHEADNCLISYTAEGKKIQLLRNNPRVCVEVSEVNSLSDWQSVIIEGVFEELNGLDAIEGIRLLSTELTRIVNDDGRQRVQFIQDMNRANEASPKVIYRIRILEKHGRFEVDSKF